MGFNYKILPSSSQKPALSEAKIKYALNQAKKYGKTAETQHIFSFSYQSKDKCNVSINMIDGKIVEYNEMQAKGKGGELIYINSYQDRDGNGTFESLKSTISKNSIVTSTSSYTKSKDDNVSPYDVQRK